MPDDSDVVDALTRLGGIATAEQLRELTSRRAVQRAVASGVVRRPRLGVLSLPVTDETEAAVRETGGVRSHLSAALAHGWPVCKPPDRPQVTVPHGTRLDEGRRAGLEVHWGPRTTSEQATGRTTALRTVVDCARALPFEDALAVADSALRAGDVGERELREAAAASPRTGRRKAVRVAGHASPLAANPFESALRAMALDAGLEVRPQVRIGGEVLIGRPDLVDVSRLLVVEAESWEFHGNRAAFERDVRRYTAMTVAGWRVVRFVWADVMTDPEETRRVLREVAGQPS